MKKFIDIKMLLLMLVAGVLIAFGVSYFTQFSFGLTLGSIILVFLVNGLIAAWEDEHHGGFNNPNQTDSKDDK
ncbi:hypothetical protein BTA51_14105 [Hahella sp. CCB-MM4]|uniref:hypothetical protein n=1 Tax=Hahella sp. (strain CCB-MM4) TaxID=1926491 RepID=UPI000B9A5BB1|nr:hypothetical protein [Hahella sp. CCB-MM4]OZG72659.1 hypothetical protein BTA51_14105 [Hahella sp. CCB-MM4]